MKIKAILGVLLMAFIIGNAAALAPGSSGSTGLEKNNFTTGDIVYFANSISTMCGEDTLWNNVTLYIINDTDILNEGTNLDNLSIVKANVTVNNKGRITTTAIWENPVVGAYDIVLDLNNDGKFDSQCPDMRDDIKPAGFVVTAAATGHSVSNISNLTSTNNTSVSVAKLTENISQGNTSATVTSAEDSGYMPIVILIISIIIAAAIIIWTILTLR